MRCNAATGYEQIVIDLSGLAQGMYVLSLVSQEGKTVTHRVIKE